MHEMKTLGTIPCPYPSINSPHLLLFSFQRKQERERERKERERKRKRERKKEREGGVLPPIIQSLSPPNTVPSTFREVAIAS